MADKETNKTTLQRATNRFPGMPFGELLTALLNEGFVVDANDFTEFTAVFESLPENDKGNLKYYLAPLICRNKEEQAKFYQVFDKILPEIKKPKPVVKPKASDSGKHIVTETTQKENKPFDLWKFIKNNLFGILFIIFIAILFIKDCNTPAPISFRKPITICPAGSNSERLGQPLSLSWNCDTVEKDRNKVSSEWDFGDGTPIKSGDTVSHIYDKTGEFNIKLRVKDKDSNVIDTSMLHVIICLPSVTLSTPVAGELNVGDTIKIKADSVHQQYIRDGFFWNIRNNDGAINENLDSGKLTFSYVAKKEGSYVITFYSAQNQCTGGQMRAIVKEPQGFTLQAIPVDQPIEKDTDVNPVYVYVFCGLSVALVFFSIFFFSRDAVPLLPKIDADELKGKAGPYDIPYSSKNHYISKLLDVSKISYNLNQRTESGNPYLDIRKTIASAIQNYGLVTPAFKARHREKEYLMLIDESKRENQQAHLFRYLVRTFLSENVCLYYYFFDKRGNVFHRENSKIPVRFSDLREKHSGANLIILGNGYHLLHPSLPIVNPSLHTEFTHWEKRIIVTPVPALDWGSKERILATSYNIVPADIEGWLNILQFINEEKPGLISFSEEDLRTYKAKYVNITNAQELKEYLSNDDDLFQWLCAICVHHKIRWEVIIGIGKTVLDGRFASHKLNYTNLLKIARISWINEGTLSTSLRLLLLKELTEDNELLARRAMLSLLEESDKLIDKTSFSYEEKLIQKYTDSFVLYANNTGKNEMYKADAEKFLSLWDDKNINDVAAAAYLENKDNQWDTPLRSVKDRSLHIGVNGFLDEIKPEFSSWYRRLGYILGGVAVLLLTILLVFFGSGKLRSSIYNSSINNSLHLIAGDYPRTADITLNFIYTSCLPEFVDSGSVYLDVISANTGKLYGEYRLDTIKASKEDTVRINVNQVDAGDLLYAGLDIVLKSVGKEARTRTTSSDKNINLTLEGKYCSSGPNTTPAIAIMYTPYVNNSTINLVRQCLTDKNLRISDTGTIRSNDSSVVLYHIRSNASYANMVAAALSQCLQKAIRSRYQDQINTDSTTIEILISSSIAKDCEDVILSDIRYLKPGYKYYSPDMKTQFVFDKSGQYLYQYKTRLQTDHALDPDIRFCNGRYIFHFLWDDHTDPPAGFENETFEFTSSSSGITIYNFSNQNFDLPLTCSLLFDPAYINNTIRSPLQEDIGEWSTGYTGASSVMEGAITIKSDNTLEWKSGFGTAPYSIEKILVDPINKTRLYYVKSSIYGASASYGLYIIRNTSRGKFFTVINEAPVNRTSDLLASLGKAKEFVQITRTQSQPNCEKPSYPATSLFFRTPSNSTITAIFTGSTPVPFVASYIGTDEYLVVMSTASSLSANPVDKTAYKAGDALGGGVVISKSKSTSFTANGLSSNTTYYFFIFPLNSNCVNGPSYNTKNVLEGSATTTDKSQASKTILWIDDHPENNAKAIDELKGYGYSISTVVSNAEARKSLNETKFDLVISDIERDKESETGLNLLPSLTKYMNEKKIIFYTSDASIHKYEDVLLKNNIGPDMIILKNDELISKVQNLLKLEGH